MKSSRAEIALSPKTSIILLMISKHWLLIELALSISYLSDMNKVGSCLNKVSPTAGKIK